MHGYTHFQGYGGDSVRTFVAPALPVQDNGIVIQYPIEKAAWIWHPDLDRITEAFVCFKNEFELKSDCETVLHLSADQRYELFIDGELVSRGPDRSDLGHWSFASIPFRFTKGTHVITAEVYWLGDKAPEAQMSAHPGFIFHSETMENLLDSGTGNWHVARRYGISMLPGLQNTYHVVGPAFKVDGCEYNKPLRFLPAKTVARQENSISGIFSTEHILYPTSIPEQRYSWFSGGRIAAVNVSKEDIVAFVEKDLSFSSKHNILSGIITVEPNSSVNILWDMEDYYCGYGHISFEGGCRAEVHIEWAESLFLPDSESGGNKPKGNRDDIAGKYFNGFGETYILSGGKAQYKSLWWRAGRYVLLRVKTSEEAVCIFGLKLETTCYPLDIKSEFHCSDDTLSKFLPLANRALQMCSHESLMDCPYYEQLMYVGDSRIDLLSWYASSNDIRFPKRCLELFDWSRWKTGFIGERYPSRSYQLSLTFSMIWVYMLHDFFMWRDDGAWIQQRLVGMRCLMENFYSLPRVDGMLAKLPGWSFVDWVGSWYGGNAPTAADGISSIINLHYLLSLLKAAEIEVALGESCLAERYRTTAAELRENIYAKFWNKERNLLADDSAHQHFSEHAQCLSILSGVIPQENAISCIEAMIDGPDVSRTTIYYSFYLFETFKHIGRGDLIIQNLSLWTELPGIGLKTTIESPEPTRSDCHSWGSHPMFHIPASLIGIRPLVHGFKQVEIKPSLGSLKRLTGKMIHPYGCIEYDLDFSNDTCNGTIILPHNLSGIFIWKGCQIELTNGLNIIQFLSGNTSIV